MQPPDYFELFARGARDGWTGFGNQAEDYRITWETYAHHSQAEQGALLGGVG